MLALYGLPMVAVGFQLNWIQIYYLSFATEVLHVAPAAIGLVIGISKLWDGISDPLAGYWSDRTHTRFGRRRPWIAAAALPFALSSYALWSPPGSLGTTGLTAWFGLCVFVVHTSYTACVIPHLSLGAELTPDPHERTRVFGARELADNVGRGLRSGRAVVQDVWRNRPARILTFVLFIEQLGFAAVGSLLPFAAEYVLETPGYTSYYLAAFAAPGFLSIPIWVRLSGRLGKRRIWMTGLALKSVGFGAVFLAPAGAIGLAFVGIGTLGFAHGCTRVMPATLLADLVDRDELVSGERKEGAYFATWNLAAKTAMGVALLVNGIGLDLAGFAPGAVQPPAVISTIRALAAGVPCVLQLVAVLAFRRYRFDEVEHARVREALAARDAGS